MRPNNLSAFLLLLLGGCGGVTITEKDTWRGEGGAAAILQLFELPSLINIISDEISPPKKGEHQTEIVAEERLSLSDGKRRSFLSVRERTEASW